MSRLDIPDRESVSEELQSVFHFVNKRFGFVPNIYRAISVSPKTLTGLTDMQGALGRALDMRSRERIALAVSQANGSTTALLRIPISARTSPNSGRMKWR